MFRKWLSLALCFLLLAPSAQAAQLLTESDTSIPGGQAPSSAASFTSSSTAAYVLDDDPYTWWARPTDIDVSSVDLILAPASPTVSAIWLRSGNHNSEWDYKAYARPNVVRVVITYQQNGTLYSAEYRYALTDVYQPDVDSMLWNNGYQCLLLPQTFTGVQTILLTVESVIDGNSLDTLCIADVMLAAQQNTPVSTQEPAFQPIETKLLMRMATRSGPSTQYEGLGSYFKEGYDVKVLSLCYDNGGTPWVQVEFTYQNRLRRAYTGLKRVDVDEALLPREEWLADATVAREVTPRFGPGTDYAARNLTLPAGLWGSIYAYENGWAQFEYYDEAESVYRRVWVLTDDLNIQ